MSKRIVLKVSGSALLATEDGQVSKHKVHQTVADITALSKVVGSLVIVVGGGNFFRGNLATEWNIERVDADHMGMLGTVMNALLLKAIMTSCGVRSIVLSAYDMTPFCEDYTVPKAQKYLDDGTVVVLAGGNGQPFVSSDFASIQRAAELGASEVVFLKRGVDGVYTADPVVDPNALCYSSIAFESYITQGLTIIDRAAVVLASSLNVLIRVVAFGERESLLAAACGENVGTVVGTKEDSFR